MKGWIAGLGILIALAACGGSESHTITGSLMLSGSDNIDYPADSFPGSECWGYSGYDDLDGNAAVTVEDEHHDVIATSSITKTKRIGTTGCKFTFTVKGVPSAKFYSVKVGHRDGPSYSAKEMDGQDWDVALSIGS